MVAWLKQHFAPILIILICVLWIVYQTFLFQDWILSESETGICQNVTKKIPKGFCIFNISEIPSRLYKNRYVNMSLYINDYANAVTITKNDLSGEWVTIKSICCPPVCEREHEICKEERFISSNK